MNNLTLPNKIFNERSCLSRKELSGYVQKQLSPSETHQVESHLIDCPLCSDAVEGLSSAEDADQFIKTTENLHFSYKTQNAIKKQKNTQWNLYYAAAAILVISLTSVLYVSLRKSPSEKLFADFYQPYPNTIPLVRGEVEEMSLEEAMVKYETGDYVNALLVFENLLSQYPDSTEIQFYAAISYLNTGQTENSIVYLNKITDKSKSEFSEPALWYRAMAYLKDNDINKAKDDLKSLISANSKYKDQARELLNKLESL
jgi:tetratricopeptide (TPR) repeat protein